MTRRIEGKIYTEGWCAVCQKPYDATDNTINTLMSESVYTETRKTKTRSFIFCVCPKHFEHLERAICKESFITHLIDLIKQEEKKE